MIVYKKWLLNRILESAKEYDSFPESWKEALKLNTTENTK